MNQYVKHPLNILPDCTLQDFRRLRESIQTYGFNPKFPILLFEGKVLDGWQRCRACAELKVTPVTAEFNGTEEEAMILVREAMLRRNMSKDQIAAFLSKHSEILDQYRAEAKERQMEHGGTSPGKKKNTYGHKSTSVRKPTAKEKAAKDFGTSRRKITRADKVKEAFPGLLEKVLKGDISLRKAEEKIKPPDPSDPIFKNLSGELNRVVDKIQKISQGDHKPKTTDDWVHLHTIQHATYDFIQHSIKFGVDVEAIKKMFYGTDEVTCPKHLKMPKSIEKEIIPKDSIDNGVADMDATPTINSDEYNTVLKLEKSLNNYVMKILPHPYLDSIVPQLKSVLHEMADIRKNL